MSFSIPDEARCQRDKLHDYEISRDLPDALIEICTKCFKKEIYYKVDGVFDVKKHLRAHIRDTVQPYGKTAQLFYELYGNKPLEDAQRLAQSYANRSKRAELKQELKEKRIAARKRAFCGSGKTDQEIEQELSRFKFKSTGKQNVSSNSN